MRIDVFYTFARFEALKANWDAIYDSDPEAQFFLSWTWLSRMFMRNPGEWCVLAVSADDGAAPYVAFLPLRLQTRWDSERGAFGNELLMAGTLFWSDYTGLLCEPGYEESAIPALAAQLKRMHWRELTLKNIRMSDRRLDLLTRPFRNAIFSLRLYDRISKDEGINLLSCPYVDLPDDFDTYLAEQVSANTRQKIRRFLRKVENSDDLRISVSTRATHQRDLDILTGHWKKKWSDKKGEDVDRLASTYREILHQGVESGHLFMPILWRGDTPLGALASFVDRSKKQLLFFVAGRDEGSNNPPPGLILHAYSIRWAIESGLKSYDLLRGDEPYKFSFGASERLIRYLIISTRSGENLNRGLAPRSIDYVLQEATRYQESDRLKRAAAGFRQILQAEPAHTTALRRYARLLFQEKEYAEAVVHYRRLVDAQPNEPVAWRGLGKSLLAQHDFVEAEKALKQVVALDTQHNVRDFFRLGCALQGQDDAEEADRCFRTALELQPEDKADSLLQKEIRGYLSPGPADSTKGPGTMDDNPS